MISVPILISVFFAVWIVRNVLFWTQLWQVKEYRLDRFLAHLCETRQGKNLYLSVGSILKLFGILLFFIVVFTHRSIILYQLFVLILYISEASGVLKELFSGTLKRPKITLKTTTLILLTLLFVYLLYSIPLLEIALWLIVIDRLVPFFIAFLVYIFSFPSELYRDFRIGKAARKIQEYPKLIVIGVTGSYGKSSTKEYIAQILSSKFKILSTKGTNNTPIGVANTVLSGLKKDTKIFVCEMGAYKKGEIAEIASIVSPRIGVLTGINEQHLSLFGSLLNTMDAKYELIDSLAENGTALFNINSSHAYKLSQRISPQLSKKKKVLYANLDSEVPRNVFLNSSYAFAENTKMGKTYISFDAILYNKEKDQKKKITGVTAPLIGLHNIENILPAMFIAGLLGLTAQEIKRAVENLTPLATSMRIKKSTSGAVLIDDSFSSNPDAVRAALSYLALYKKTSQKSTKKVFILSPLIELGKNAKEEHYRIGQEIGNVCDTLFVTNRNFYDSLEKGIEDSGGRCEIIHATRQEIISYIQDLGKDDIVMFEGRETVPILKSV